MILNYNDIYNAVLDHIYYYAFKINIPSVRSDFHVTKSDKNAYLIDQIKITC